MNDNQTINDTPVTQDGVANNDVTTQTTTTTTVNDNDGTTSNDSAGGGDDDFGKLYDDQLKSKTTAAEGGDGSKDDAIDEGTGTKKPIPTKKTSKANVSDDDGKADESDDGDDGVQDENNNTSDIKERNRINAERRIKNKQKRAAKHNEAVQARIAAMQKDLDYYSEYAQKHPEQDAQVKAASQMIQGRMDDMMALQQDQALDEFTDRANETFGEDTEANAEFIEQTERYAQYVNDNEPALGKMIQRPYGLIVLKEWMDAMDEPANRSTWENFTEFEKQEALTKLNKSVVSSFKKPVNKEPTTAKKAATRTNVPVPASGRAANASNDETPIDDFAQAYQSLVNKKRKHRLDNSW